MVNWKVTATTIYCDGVGDEVTVMVYKDGQTRCTGYVRYGASGQSAKARMGIRSKGSKRKLECQGPACPLVTRYRDKLLAEEAGEAHGEQ